MDEFSPKIRGLIERARADDEPSARDRARVRGKLAVTAAPLVGTLGASLAAKSAAAATGAKAAGLGVAVVAKWTAGVVVALAVGAGAYQTLETSKDRPAASEAPEGIEASAALAARERAPVKEGQKTAEKTTEVPSASGTLPKRVVIPSRAAADGGRKAGDRGQMSILAPPSGAEKRGSEVDLLAQAQSQLSKGQAAEALSLVEAHRRVFPRSALGAEGLAVQVLALCQLGRTLEAERALAEFQHIAPSSPVGPRLLASCAGASRRSHDSNTIPPLTGN